MKHKKATIMISGVISILILAGYIYLACKYGGRNVADVPFWVLILVR